MVRRMQSVLSIVLLCAASPSVLSSYEDRPPMNENAYFGERMAEHGGHNLYQEPQGRGGGYRYLLGALAGIGIEWFWTGRYVKKLKKEHDALSAEFVANWHKDRDALMARRTYPIKLLAHRVEEADMQLVQLIAAAEDAGVDMGLGGGRGFGSSRSLAQDSLDYEEFRQPDVNGDNVISKSEFNQYIRQYLLLYPDTPAADIPRFEDFDLNRDGLVTFDEWQMYLDQHRQAEQYRDSDMLRGMYDTSANSQGFNQLAQNMQRAQRGLRY